MAELPSRTERPVWTMVFLVLMMTYMSKIQHVCGQVVKIPMHDTFPWRHRAATTSSENTEQARSSMRRRIFMPFSENAGSIPCSWEACLLAVLWRQQWCRRLFVVEDDCADPNKETHEFLMEFFAKRATGFKSGGLQTLVSQY